MHTVSFFEVLKSVITDWRFIGATTVVLLYINFMFYILKYKKKKKIKTKRIFIKKQEQKPNAEQK